MVNIEKGPPPASLAQYKREAVNKYGKKLKAEHIFDDFPEKNELRTELIRLQGGLCAYCMSRIKNDPLETKLEHCHSQDEYPEEKLNFGNLLLCCKGNEGQNPEDQHCDTRKGKKSFSFNPSKKQFDMSGLIKYKRDGTIFAENESLDQELNTMLNLNFIRLKNNREKIIIAVEQVLGKHPGTRTPGEIERLIDSWQRRKAAGEKNPFYGVALYILNKHFQSKKK